MIENAYQYMGEKSYSRKADVNMFLIEEGVKKTLNQKGELIEYKIKKVTLRDKETIGKQNHSFIKKISDTYPFNDQLFFEKCAEVIKFHYETKPMLLSKENILQDLKCIDDRVSIAVLDFYIKKMGIPTSQERKRNFKNKVIFPMIIDSIRNLNYKCTINDIVRYLNKNGFEDITGVSAKRMFVQETLKNYLNLQEGDLSREKTDWRAILNDYNAI